jgi:hypothetical protein
LPYALAPFVIGTTSVHRDPSHVRDDHDTPLLSGRDGNRYALIFPSGKAKYFLFWGLTRFPKSRSDLPVGSICRAWSLPIVIATYQCVGRIEPIGAARCAVPMGVIRRFRLIPAPSSPLAEITTRFDIASPIFRKRSRAHIAMKRGIRPIAHARDEAVLERIDMAILDVACVIRLVADQVLPERALPDTAFIAGNTNGAEPLLLRQRARKPALDQPPARGEITIAGRQLPDRMQMIGQHDECVDRKGMALPRCGNGLTQSRDMIDEQGFRRSRRLTVKNQPPPATNARR